MNQYLKKEIIKKFYIFFIILSFFLLQSCESLNNFSNQTSNNKDTILNLGKITVMDRNSPYIIAAPHGGYDSNTEDIVLTFCANQNWDCIIATGYRTSMHPFNVNRPTEKIDVPKDEEIHSEAAKIVYEYYLENFNKIGGKKTKLYVEIHGNSRYESRQYIEIAQVGIDNATGKLIQSFLNNKLQEAGIKDTVILWEGDPGFFFNAESTKEFGILRLTPKAIHIEIPYFLRKYRKDLLDIFFANALPKMVKTYFP